VMVTDVAPMSIGIHVVGGRTVSDCLKLPHSIVQPLALQAHHETSLRAVREGSLSMESSACTSMCIVETSGSHALKEQDVVHGRRS